MNTELILKNIGKHIQLSPTEEEYFTSLLHEKKVRRRQLYLQEGDICRHTAFVTAGCLRSYTTDKEGIEHVIGFAPMDWWVADMHSYLSQQPAILSIETLDDSEMLQISLEDQQRLYRKVPKFERFFRILTEKSLISHQHRLIDNLSLSAEERYRNFCKKHPSLIESVPQKHIASYIGVTPEFFSKMRNRLLNKQ